MPGGLGGDKGHHIANTDVTPHESENKVHAAPIAFDSGKVHGTITGF